MIDKIIDKVRSWKRWWKNFNHLVRFHQSEMQQLREYMESAKDYIRAKTTMHADVRLGPHDASAVILIGHYNGGDYVEVFNVRNEDLGAIVRQMQDYRRFAGVGRIDAYPPVRKFIKEDLLR